MNIYKIKPLEIPLAEFAFTNSFLISSADIASSLPFRILERHCKLTSKNLLLKHKLLSDCSSEPL